MTKRKIEATSGPQPIGAYSQGVRVGKFIFVSGQGPFDSSSGEVCGDNIEKQTARTLGNIKAVLEAGGASMADVVKATAHLSDIAVRALQAGEIQPGDSFWRVGEIQRPLPMADHPAVNTR
ncbi:MAG TPA: Rid family hydrolase [Burkholderiaceae bacterium]|nr:Rid family hydrolase [Burkholderiaceae bacterium]